MPLFGKRKECGSGSKTKLENKLYLARENPEPVFDISDCDLKNVPPGIFSLCKVFRKESLYLQDNRLVTLTGGGNMQDLSLLQVLDLHGNCLTMLPNEIRYLKILKVLNISHNKLTTLPDAVGSLVSLGLLDVSHNNLKVLTAAIGDLRSLQELNIQGNKLITALPSSLCHATSLKNIRLDVEAFCYPPKEVLLLGTEAIMRSLAQDAGFNYETAVEISEADNAPSDAASYLDGHLQAKILELDRLKGLRRQDLLALTIEMDERQRMEYEVCSANGRFKDKLLSDLASESSRIDGELRRAALGNEATRARLAAAVRATEQAANAAVASLLSAANTERTGDAARLAAKELRDEQDLLAGVAERHDALRREDVLRSMRDAVEAQARLDTRLGEISADRADQSQALINWEASEGQALSSVLSMSVEERARLLSRLARDESAQRAAVAALLEGGDARSWALGQQLRTVEVQLAAITAAEVRRRQLQIEQQTDDLCDQRIQLSALLVDLLDRQAVRRAQLLRTVEQLAALRGDDGANFWLLQYQRLLDAQPATQRDAERSLDPRLAQRLLLAGAFHYLPMLAQPLRDVVGLRAIDDARLRECGLRDADVRNAVMEAIRNHLREDLDKGGSEKGPDGEGPASKTDEVPLAPGIEEVLENAWGEAECVVCMEAQCAVVLVPCGHMCVCATCAAAITLCPLCRAEIMQKVRAILP